jgi:hypothetical protein
MLLRPSTAELLADRIPRCRWSAVGFEPRGRAILYSRQPEPGSVPAGEEMYHRHVLRHILGAPAAGDVRVFGEGRDKLGFPESISFSPDGRWAELWSVEYGSAQDAEAFGWLYSYSPYHHVRDGVEFARVHRVRRASPPRRL